MRAALLLLLLLAACGGDGAPRLSLDGRLRLADAVAGPEAAADARLQVLQAEPGAMRDPALLARIAAEAERAGRWPEAMAAQRALLAHEGPSERRLVAIGRILLRQEDAEGAAAAFAQAAAIAPRSVAALAGLGLAHDLRRDRAAAQEAYRRALAVMPANWPVRSNLAVSLVASGRHGEAQAALADAEWSAEAPTYARHNLAMAFAAEGQAERAVRVLRAEMGPVEAQALAEDLGAFARALQP